MDKKQEKICEKLHKQAMELSDDAFFAERDKVSEDLVKKMYLDAFDKEKQAALMLKDEHELEPSRGILFRSAAELALSAGRNKDAKEMAEEGLRGKKLYEEIREELKDVLKRAIVA